MLVRITQYRSEIFSAITGLFFILLLHVKISYSLIPILLAVAGIVCLVPSIRKRQFQLSDENKWLVGTFVFYFVLFLLSQLIYHGKGRELDLPSRALLVLPVLAVCYRHWIKAQWVLYSILIASFVAGISAFIQTFALHRAVLFPIHMYIQAGDMAMSLSMFSFAILFYFHKKQNKLMTTLSLVAGLFGLVASFLIKARGAWIGVPVVLLVILYVNRRAFSKWVVSALLLAVVSGGIFASNTIYKRYLDAERDIIAYSKGNSRTSVGARFDMWKSAWIGIQEKPIFGWGIVGAQDLRKQHAQEGKIGKMSATFTHSHNQYLQDTLTRGMLGLVALLAAFLVPMTLFIKGIRKSESDLAFTWGALGIVHVLLMMSYCLTQSVLAHNSGMMFYFFTTVLFLGLQKIAQK